jgi:hypothetical protein
MIQSLSKALTFSMFTMQKSYHFGQQRGQQPPLKRHATDNLLNAENLRKTLQMLNNKLLNAKQ